MQEAERKLRVVLLCTGTWAEVSKHVIRTGG